MTHDDEVTPFAVVRNVDKLAAIPQDRQKEEIDRGIELGLEAADSVVDRSISTFSRGHQPTFAGINTFLKPSTWKTCIRWARRRHRRRPVRLRLRSVEPLT